MIHGAVGSCCMVGQMVSFILSSSYQPFIRTSKETLTFPLLLPAGLIMKLALLTLVSLAAEAHAFVGPLPIQECRAPMTTSRLAVEPVELEPEPEGGIELAPFTSIAGCRMKQLDEEVKVSNSENKGPAYKFWMTAQAEVRCGVDAAEGRSLKEHA